MPASFASGQYALIASEKSLTRLLLHERYDFMHQAYMQLGSVNIKRFHEVNGVRTSYLGDMTRGVYDKLLDYMRWLRYAMKMLKHRCSPIGAINPAKPVFGPIRDLLEPVEAKLENNTKNVYDKSKKNLELNEHRLPLIKMPDVDQFVVVMKYGSEPRLRKLVMDIEREYIRHFPRVPEKFPTMYRIEIRAVSGGSNN